MLSKLANELMLKGHKVTIVVPSTSPNPYYKTDANICVFIGRISSHKKIDLIVNLYRMYKKCKRIKCDLAIANYNLTAYIVVLLPSHVKKVYYVQAFEALHAKRKYMKLIAYLSYFLPLTKILNKVDLLPSRFGATFSVVPAGIDLALFNSARVPLAVKSTVTIGLIGRKEKYKGTLESVIALQQFRKIYPLVNFSINIAIHVPIEAHSLLGDFNFCQIENEGDLADFYKRCDIVIAVGLIEDGAFHYPCAEAMASNCLTISNYSPLVETSSLLAVSTYSIKNITSKLRIALAMRNSDILNEIESNRSIIESYSWEVVGEKFNNILLEIAGR